MKTKKLTGLFVLVIVFFLIPFFGVTQSVAVSNIHFRIIDDKIEVFYDLPINPDSVIVKLVFRKETDPQFKYAPKFVKGDIGEGIYAGPNKKIVWNYLKEPDYVFTGSGFYFDLTAKLIPKKPKATPESITLNKIDQVVDEPSGLDKKPDVTPVDPAKIDKMDLPVANIEKQEVVVIPEEKQVTQEIIGVESIEEKVGGEEANQKPDVNKPEENAAVIVVPVPVQENIPEPVTPKELVVPTVINEVTIDPITPKTEEVINDAVLAEAVKPIAENKVEPGAEIATVVPDKVIGKAKVRFSKDNESAGIDYERSSLCMFMISDTSRTFANVIEDAANSYPLPEKFNDHNLNVKTIKCADKLDDPEIFIDDYFNRNNVAKDLVARWFNRSESGGFDMSLISERGRYDATEIEANIAQMAERGMAQLSDAGEELIDNTFIVVNDFRYVNKEETANKIKAGFKIYNMAQAFIPGAPDLNTVTQIASVGLTVAGKGYVIKTTSYLFRLVWNTEIANDFYTNYWTSDDKLDAQKKAEFDRSDLFKLRYVGFEVSLADLQSTIFTTKSEEELIKIATIRGVDASIAKLQRKYEEFRTKTPLASGAPLTAQIGLKEGLEDGDKFEVLEQTMDSEGKMIFKSIGVIKVDGKQIWDNRYMAGEDDSANKNGYTLFKGKIGFEKGLLIRQID